MSIVETIASEVSALLRTCGTAEISEESMTASYRTFVGDIFGSDGMLLSLTKNQFTIRPEDFVRHLASTNQACGTPGTEFMDSCEPTGQAPLVGRAASHGTGQSPTSFVTCLGKDLPSDIIVSHCLNGYAGPGIRFGFNSGPSLGLLLASICNCNSGPKGKWSPLLEQASTAIRRSPVLQLKRSWREGGTSIWYAASLHIVMLCSARNTLGCVQ